jgi:single-stranded-DNA-specific exonuclease
MPIDAEVPFRELTPRSVRELQALEPCGEGNPAALFRARDVEVRAANVFGPERGHLSLWLRQADGVPLETIAWRRAELLRFFPTGRRLDVLFTVEASSWDGDETVRLELRDVRAAGRSEPRWTSPVVGDSLSLGVPVVS